MSLKNYSRKNSLQQTAEETAVGKINFENNAQFNGYKDLDNIYDKTPLQANYTRQEINNVDIPVKIGREIRAQKYRIFIVSFISFLMMVVGVFFIACYYGAKKVASPSSASGFTKWLIPSNNVPVPGAMFPLLIVGLLIFTLAMIEYANLLTNVRAYKIELLRQNDTQPYFLIKTYKSLIARVVYANWLAISLYVIEGVIIGIFWGVREIHEPSVYMHFGTELIIMYILAGVTFALHMFTLLTARYRKGNINSFFNTQVVSTDEAHKISSHANKICLICFIVLLAVIFFCIAIPWLIIRRKKKKPMLP